MAAAVHVCFYENAFQETMEGAAALSINPRERFKMPVNAPGRMFFSDDVTTTTDWQEIGEQFPNEASGFTGGIVIVTVDGGDIDIFVGKRKADQDPAFWDKHFDGVQRAYGMRLGDVVKVRDSA